MENPVVILHNSVSRNASADEKDVLLQAAEVGAALRRLGYKSTRMGAGLDLSDLRKRLRAKSPQLVFNLVESLGGSGRLIHFAPSLLDDLQIPYTGAPAEGMFLSSNKMLTKQVLAVHEIATPVWTDDGNDTAKSGGVWIIKSVWEDASIGLEDSCVVKGESVRAVLRDRSSRYGGHWFAERYVEGREFNIALLARGGGVECLPPAEMLFVDYPAAKPKIVNYAAKWHAESFEYSHTVRRFDMPATDSRLVRRLQDLSLRCWSVLGLRGYARVDVRVDGRGQPWVLEVNANPCLSSDAGFAAAVAEAGLTMDQAIKRIVDASRPMRHEDRHQSPTTKPSRTHVSHPTSL